MKSFTLKHVLVMLALVVGLSVTLATGVAAVDGIGTSNPQPDGMGTNNTPATKFTPLTNPLSSNIGSVGELVQKFVEIFSYLVIIFAVLMLIWTGLQYILARGNPAKMTELNGRLVWILIGIAIVIGARVMITIIINTLEATGTVNQGTLNSVNNAVQGR